MTSPDPYQPPSARVDAPAPAGPPRLVHPSATGFRVGAVFALPLYLWMVHGMVLQLLESGGYAGSWYWGSEAVAVLHDGATLLVVALAGRWWGPRARTMSVRKMLVPAAWQGALLSAVYVGGMALMAAGWALRDDRNAITAQDVYMFPVAIAIGAAVGCVFFLAMALVVRWRMRSLEGA